MFNKLDENRPIFQQITDYIQNEIVTGRLNEEEKVPSTNELSRFYQINPATAAKGINVLVDKGIIYKKRGVGMFVATGAKKQVIQERKEKFHGEYIVPMLQEANNIGLSTEEIFKYIKGSEKSE